MSNSIKPRAKWLHELLRSKHAARHATLKVPSRQKQKQELRRELVSA